MSFRIIKLLACSALTVALAVPALSQSASTSKSGRLPSTNPSSTLKRTVNDESAAATAATAAPITGTFVARFTIKLTTPVPSGDSLFCNLSASTYEENTSTYTINNEIEETAATKATVSGSSATCTVTIPYSWYLTTPSSDTVALSYSLYYLDPSATNQSSETRASSQYVPGAGAIKVPSNGTLTTYTINATL